MKAMRFKLYEMADWIAISADEFPRSDYRNCLFCRNNSLLSIIDLRELNGKRLKLAGNQRL